MKQYKYAVERPDGQEVVSITLETAKPSSVQAQHMDNGLVRLVMDGDVIATGTSYIDAEEVLTLRRWVHGKKLGKSTDSRVQ